MWPEGSGIKVKNGLRLKPMTKVASCLGGGGGVGAGLQLNLSAANACEAFAITSWSWSWSCRCCRWCHTDLPIHSLPLPHTLPPPVIVANENDLAGWGPWGISTTFNLSSSKYKSSVKFALRFAAHQSSTISGGGEGVRDAVHRLADRVGR